MSLQLRTVVGFAAAFMAIALVALAGLTAPAAQTTLHASSGCPDAAKARGPDRVASGAERPA